jgi:hypothetical protein
VPTAEQHRENTQRLERIGSRVAKIETDVQPLAKTVATTEPIVAGYTITRRKLADAFAVGTALVTAFGWSVSLFAGKNIGLGLSAILISPSKPRRHDEVCVGAFVFDCDEHGAVDGRGEP